MKYLLPFALVAGLFIGGCSMPTSYYTNPQSAGYNQQGLGAICPYCDRQVLISGNQLNNVSEVTCANCGQLFNTKAAAQAWVLRKPQVEQQQAAALFTGALQGVSQGLEQQNANRANIQNPPNTINSYPKSWTVNVNGKTTYCTQYYDGGTVQCN